MTPEYVLRKSLCRRAHCFSAHVPGKGYIGKGDTPESKPDYDRQREQSAKSEIDNLGYAPGFAEKGYDEPRKGVLFANWNVFPSKIDDILERMGYSCEWSDEWTTCEDCGKAVRTSPDCYHWQPYYVLIGECSTVCLNCVNWTEYLESIEDKPDMACMAECDPREHGYTLISEPEEFESGFHPGQDDKPGVIAKRLWERGHKRLVFRIAETSQFYIRFEVWKWEEEE